MDPNTIDRRKCLRTLGAGLAVGVAGCAGGSSGGSDGGDESGSGDGGSSSGTTVGTAGGGTDTVTIGAIYPLSGGSSSAGQTIQKLVRNAVTVVNEDHSDLAPLVLAEGEGLPNLDGAQVEVRFADHRTDPAQGRAEANRLIDEGVDIILGCFNSSVTKTVSQAAEQAGIPHVSNCSSSPTLTQRGFEWFYRTAATNITSVRNQYQMLNDINEARDAGLETVAVIHEDTEFGAVVADLQEEYASEFGFELVMDPISYTAESVSSLQSQVARIKDADPDVMFPTSYLRDALLLLNDMETLNYVPPIMIAVGAGFGQAEFRNDPVSDYTCATSAFSQDLKDEKPQIGVYSDYVEQATGVTLSFIYMNAWGGVPSMLKAVDNAGSTDPAAIQSALNSLELETAAETGMPHGIRYDEKHDNELASNVVVQDHPDGPQMAWTNQGLVSDQFTFPMPAWSNR
jgi:branched-chain amino acid transport system substrate-binding protein